MSTDVGFALSGLTAFYDRLPCRLSVLPWADLLGPFRPGNCHQGDATPVLVAARRGRTTSAEKRPESKRSARLLTVLGNEFLKLRRLEQIQLTGVVLDDVHEALFDYLRVAE